MTGERERRILDLLAEHGGELPIVVLARRAAMPPSSVVAILDDLHDAGLVVPGAERSTVGLAPRPAQDGRFTWAGQPSRSG